MFQRSTTFFCLLFITLLPAANAAWSWPFSSAPKDDSVAEQTEAAQGLYNRAIKLRANGQLTRAAKRFKTIYKKYPGADFADDATFQYGELTYQKKQWQKSFIAFQTLLIRHPDFENFDQVVDYQFRIALSLADGDGLRFALVFPARAWERSASYFEILLQNAPYSDLAPLALMNIALIHQHLGNTARAVDALDRLINLYPESVLADDAYLELGDTFASLNDGPLYDQGSTREALSYYEDFLVLFPDHSDVAAGEVGLSKMRNAYAESKLVIGEYYYRYRKWYEAAEIFFNEAITLAPESEAALKAREYLDKIEARGLKAREAANAPQKENVLRPRTTWVERLLFWRKSSGNAPADATPAETETTRES